jgi:phosphatidyl-myo-inositol alpha-mannosyltransferase
MIRPLRIAMVTEYAYPVLGGISEHVHFLSRELAELGHDVTVVTSNQPRGSRLAAERIDAEHRINDGYRTARMGHSLPIVANGSIARVSVGRALKRRLARVQAPMDVVHAQGLAAPFMPLWALRASKALCTVGTFHTYFDGGHVGYRFMRPYVATALGNMDRKIAVSQACVVSLEQYFPDEEFDIVPNGIDTDFFSPLASADDRAPGPHRILFVGRFDPRNGLGTLLDAARILQDRGLDFEVQVIGDGPARPLYEHHAKKAGVWDRIRWLGLLNEERPELYRQATVLAAPCTLASFGVVLLEAFASGIPVVCADNIGFRQVIRDGAPGEFVTGDDPVALADGLAKVLADPTLRTDWGRRGRVVAEERYAWPIVARRIEEIYAEVLASKGVDVTAGRGMVRRG